MIDEIHVKDLALIKEATLAPARGLTVITGETGAGKSALLSAIKLLVGERADASTVRQGANACTVEGRLFREGEAGDGTVAVRRVSSDGRSRVTIDGSLASVSELASTVGARVDLCGQHEHQRLLKQPEHLRLLDAWGGDAISAAKCAYEAAWDEAHRAASELARLEEAQRASSESIEEARFALSRIEEVSPLEGEYEELMAELPLRENAEALAHASLGAHEALSGEGGAIDAVVQASALLESMAGIDARYGESAQALREACFVLEDVSRDARSFSEEAEFDPAELAAVQERVSAFQGLMRAYGPRMEDVFARRDAAHELLAVVDDASEALSQAQSRCERAEAALKATADELAQRRREVAPAFAREVCSQMERLEMGSASIEVGFADLPREQWTSAGSDRVELLFRPGSGMQPRPLARIASGGEVSRVMLAIKTVLGTLDSAETLVFDEVDAGVGGATARALAEVLADLAKCRQVIAVTHLPQVAVLANAHFLVEKEEREDGFPESSLRPLEGEERVKEVARMLSGDEESTSLEHARRMLSQAGVV